MILRLFFWIVPLLVMGFHSAMAAATLGLNYTTIHYQQFRTDYQGKAITLKASHGLMGRKFEYSSNGYVTVLPFSQNRDVDMRFMGANLRGGYAFVSKPKGRIRLLLGVYYVTTFVKDDLFGYQNFWGPQVTPSFLWYASSKLTFGLYGKYSTVADGSSGLFGNRELAAGFHLKFGGKSSRPIALTFDFASLEVVIGAVRAESRTVSSGFSFGLF